MLLAEKPQDIDKVVMLLYDMPDITAIQMPVFASGIQDPRLPPTPPTTANTVVDEVCTLPAASRTCMDTRRPRVESAYKTVSSKKALMLTAA